MYKYDNEERLLILLSRITFSEEEILEIDRLTKEKIDWNYILLISIKNKVVALIWNTIRKFSLITRIPRRIIQVMKFTAIGTRNRIEEYIRLAEMLGNVLENNGIEYAFLKGSFLIPNMYKEYDMRTMNDVDIFINKSDKNRIDKLMKELGFLQGEYSENTHSVEPLSREKRIFWVSKMNNLFPYIKFADSDYINCFKVDFAFRLDVHNTEEDMTYFYAVMNTDGTLPAAYFFLHLCCHFYKEAIHLIWIYNGSDINLIKMCDILEFFRTKMTESERVEAMRLAETHGHSQDVYYTLQCISEIYGINYDKYISMLSGVDKSILDFFIGNKNQRIKWKNNIHRRIFSLNNQEEIEGQVPEYRLL